jgi:hypothetical protein
LLLLLRAPPPPPTMPMPMRKRLGIGISIPISALDSQLGRQQRAAHPLPTPNAQAAGAYRPRRGFLHAGCECSSQRGLWALLLLLLLLLPASPSRRPTTTTATAASGRPAIAYMSHWCPTQRACTAGTSMSVVGGIKALYCGGVASFASFDSASMLFAACLLVAARQQLRWSDPSGRGQPFQQQSTPGQSILQQAIAGFSQVKARPFNDNERIPAFGQPGFALPVNGEDSSVHGAGNEPKSLNALFNRLAHRIASKPLAGAKKVPLSKYCWDAATSACQDEVILINTKGWRHTHASRVHAGAYNGGLPPGCSTCVLTQLPPKCARYVRAKPKMVRDFCLRNDTKEAVNGAARSFHYFKTQLGWQDAEKSCSDNGGHLADAQSLAKNQELLKQCSAERCWIGLNDRAAEGNFLWADGTKLGGNYTNYTNWATGEPNNGGSKVDSPDDEDCGYLHGMGYHDTTKHGLWGDHKCDDKLAYVCSLATIPVVTPAATNPPATASAASAAAPPKLTTTTAKEPSCKNGVVDGEETGIDCGGAVCPTCSAGRGCATNSDCTSANCLGDGTCTGAHAPTTKPPLQSADATEAEVARVNATFNKLFAVQAAKKKAQAKSRLKGLALAVSAISKLEGGVAAPTAAPNRTAAVASKSASLVSTVASKLGLAPSIAAPNAVPSVNLVSGAQGALAATAAAIAAKSSDDKSIAVDATNTTAANATGAKAHSLWALCWDAAISACASPRRVRLFGEAVTCGACVSSRLPPRMAWKCARFIRTRPKFTTQVCAKLAKATLGGKAAATAAAAGAEIVARSCVSWRNAGGCAATGAREPTNDLGCTVSISRGASPLELWLMLSCNE